MKNNHVIIIGAGIGGLALGIRLAADGYRVKIFEKNARPGGWLKTTRVAGFTFQNGGNILTMPHLIEELFTQAGRSMADYLTLRELNPILQMRFPDERSFFYYRESAERAIRNPFFTLKDQQAHHKYVARGERALDQVGARYTKEALRAPNPIAALFGVRWPRPGRNFEESAGRLFDSPALRQVFSFWPLVCGGNPAECSHLYRMIPAALQRWGAFVPMGGPDALTDALVRLYLDCGGELLLNSEVRAIQVFNGKATGVRLTDGSIHQSDYVISDAEAAKTCAALIDSDRARFFAVDQSRRKEKGISVFIYHLGFRHPLEETRPLSPFNVIFPENMDEWQKSLFQRRECSDEPFFFLSCPEKIDPSYVPEGKSGLTVIVPVPNTENGYPWELESYAYRSKLLNCIQKLYQEDVRSALDCERFITPPEIAAENGAEAGMAWSYSPTQTWIRPARLSNQVAGIRDLYLVGNGAHPGPMIPAVLRGAALVNKMITRG